MIQYLFLYTWNTYEKDKGSKLAVIILKKNYFDFPCIDRTLAGLLNLIVYILLKLKEKLPLL